MIYTSIGSHAVNTQWQRAEIIFGKGKWKDFDITNVYLPPARSKPAVPPFDPLNPVYVAAWESIIGLAWRRRRRNHDDGC